MKKYVGIIIVLLALAGTALGQVDTVWTYIYTDSIPSNGHIFNDMVIDKVNNNIFLTGEGDSLLNISINCSNKAVNWAKILKIPSSGICQGCCFDSNFIYTAGSIDPHGTWNWLLIKIDKLTGDTIWTKVDSIGISGQAYDIVVNNDTLYVIGGNNSNLQLRKYNKVDKSFIGAFTLTPSITGDGGNRLCIDSLSNIYCTGQVKDAGNYSDFLTMKIDSAGDSSWSDSYGNVSLSDMGMDCILSGNDLYAVGYSEVVSGSNSIVLIKYNKDNGNVAWLKSFNKYQTQNGNACAVSKNNEIYVSGVCIDGASSKLVLVKYNQNGDTLWSKILSYPGVTFYNCNACALDDSNNIYLAGMFQTDPYFSAFVIKLHEVKNNLVAHYLFNGNARDTSGYGNHGTVNGAVPTTDRYGQAGQAFKFDGVDDYIEAADSPSLDISPSISMCLWVRPDTCPQRNWYANNFINKSGDYYTENYAFDITSTSGTTVDLRFFAWIDASPFVRELFNWLTPDKVGKWYFLAVVSDSILGTVKFYQNDSVLVEFSGPSHLSTNNGSLWLGGKVDTSGFYHNYFDGALDDIRIYNRALTEAEVLTIYNQEKPPDSSLVAHYLFNGNARDTSGCGNHGTIIEATPTTDRFGQPNNAYQFDGINDYITVPHNSLFNFSTEFTFSFWMKPSSPIQTSDAGLIAKGTGPTEVYCVDLSSINGDDLRFFCWAGGSPYVLDNLGWLDSAKVDKWYQVIARYRGAAQIGELFINGQFLSSATFPSILETNTEEIAFAGQRSVIYDKFFNGCLDDIRIYNRALSDAEVLALYNEEKPIAIQPPQLIFPPNNAILDTINFTFFWHRADSAIAYHIQNARGSVDSFLPGHMNVDYVTASGLDTSLLYMTIPERRYYWRVRSIRGPGDTSAWSPAWTYLVDVTAPLPPALKGPPDNAWVSGGPTLQWAHQDGNSAYHAQVSSDTLFGSFADTATTVDSFYAVPPKTDGKYFWRVRAQDGAGYWSAFSEVRRYRLDATNPQIVYTWPDSGRINFMFNDTIKIAFSEPIMPGSFLYNCSPSVAGWYGSSSANYDTMKLWTAMFDTGQTYTFTITQAFDSAGNGLAAGDVPNPFTFTTTTDGVGPVIVHTPGTAVLVPNNVVSVPATVTDAGSGVGQVYIDFKMGGQTTFIESQMNFQGGSSYLGQIPGPTVGGRGLSYYIRAVDVLGAESVSPPGAPADRYYRTVGIDTAMFDGTLSGGSYRMVSVPFNPGNPPYRPYELVDDFGAYDDTIWRFFRWQSGAYAEYNAVDDIVPGRAYWLITKTGGTFDVADARSVPDSAWHIPLASGWNMIGTPFDYPVNLSEVWVYDGGGTSFRFTDTDNTLTEQRLVDYIGAGYANKTQLEAWKGYWVKSNFSNIIMTVPAVSALGKGLEPEPPYPTDGWLLALEVVCGAYHDRDNRIGISSRGARGNASEPPAVGPHVSLAMAGGGGPLAEDYRAEIGEGQCWRFTVETDQGGTAELSWREEGARVWQYAVYDVTAGIALPLTGQYAFQPEPGRGREFAVLAGSDEYISAEARHAGLVPTATLMEQGRPNPFNQKTTINYQIATGGPVRMAVYNIAGQLVLTLVDKTQMPGRYAERWDGRDDRGRQVSNGIYFIRLEAGDAAFTGKATLLR